MREPTLVYPGLLELVPPCGAVKIVTEGGELRQMVRVIDDDGGHRFGRIEQIELQRRWPKRRWWQLRKPPSYVERRVIVSFGKRGYPYG